MAWTTKADRFGSSGPNATTGAQHIGPGHYKLDPAIRGDAEHGYAPFSSTVPKAAASKDGRDSATGNCQGPPPGSYDPKLPGKFDPGLPRKTVPFGMSSTRIDLREKTKIDSRPGPGQYAVDPGLPPAQASRTMGIVPGEKSVVRSSSAPSIPQSHQAYGYEEVGGGRLVRQGPKDGSLFCSGRSGDSAGPGQYDQTDNEIARPRPRNGAFLKGPARVPLDGPDRGDRPGPGHYTQKKSSLELHSSSYVGGASFASASERGATKGEAKRAATCPGPGTYPQNARPKPDLRELRSELQYFGSTVERFQGGGNKPSVPSHIGPGHYTRILRKPEPPNVRGFCQTEGRFKEGREVPGVLKPGPGQYDIPGISEDTMSGPLATFSMLGNSGGLAFGAMSKRLTYPSGDDAPGPGYYKVPCMSDDAEEEEAPANSKWKSRKPTRSRLPGAAFASKTPKDQSTRGAVREGLQRPPPGAYDPVLVKDQGTVVRLRSKSEGFLMSALDRFQGGPLEAPKGYQTNIGPGKYSLQDVTGGKRVGTFNRSICEGMPESGRPKGLGFEAQDKRFRHTSCETKGPGPGSYCTDPTWITKSHNCYFGDVV